MTKDTFTERAMKSGLGLWSGGILIGLTAGCLNLIERQIPGFNIITQNMAPIAIGIPVSLAITGLVLTAIAGYSARSTN